ncbi:hypothetical protein ZWY2020_023838 [Hordeum vulgare]|nr:hypothetical protein ZWY2020_023838 [Hordeum vulgare]
MGVVDFLLEPEPEKASHELAHEYTRYVNKNRYLIVLTELSTIEEWHRIKSCFPENKLGSRIIVSSKHLEVASLCSGQESIASELKQLSAEQTIYAFYLQSSQDISYSLMNTTSSTLPYTAENEIQEDQCDNGVDGKMMVQESLTRTNTMACVLEEFQLIGREKEKADIIELIREHAFSQSFQVIAVWGMGGLGKTTLIKDVYHRQEVSDMFGKHAFVTVLRPFKLEDLLRSLADQFQENRREEKKRALDFLIDTKKEIPSKKVGVAKPIEELAEHLKGKKCLIVLDDLSSTMEWDKIMPSLLEIKNPCLVIVITTRREDIAKHCCKKPEYLQEKECIRLLSRLQDKHACDLFTKKVFKNKTTDLANQYPELVAPAELILKKCNGLPLAIVTIAGFLADQPKNAAEWRKLNEHISVELEMNPNLKVINAVLMKSYDGLPYYLKSCFLYMSIFGEDRNVSRRRLVGRWIAEGIGKLKNLHTMGSVHLDWGNAVVEEIKGLTNLRKLGVELGINKKIGQKFCSAISGLSRLESLSLKSLGEDLYDYLDGTSSPPENLQSLKLFGQLRKCPQWIKSLQNLVKVSLEITRLSGEGETIQVLGKLPNLSTLRLEEGLHIEGPITFPSGLFGSLTVLHLDYRNTEITSLEFEPTSMPKLEVLSLRFFHFTSGFSGLEFLQSVKQVRLSVCFLGDIIKRRAETEDMTEEEAEKEAKRREDKVKEDIRNQLAKNQNGPILKVEQYWS